MGSRKQESGARGHGVESGVEPAALLRTIHSQTEPYCGPAISACSAATPRCPRSCGAWFAPVWSWARPTLLSRFMTRWVKRV